MIKIIKTWKRKFHQNAQIIKVWNAKCDQNSPSDPPHVIFGLKTGSRGTPWNRKNAGPGGSDFAKCRFWSFKWHFGLFQGGSIFDTFFTLFHFSLLSLFLFFTFLILSLFVFFWFSWFCRFWCFLHFHDFWWFLSIFDHFLSLFLVSCWVPVFVTFSRTTAHSGHLNI